MGSGKSTVGRLLARKLGKFFIDSDALIETMENRPVREIFEHEGEAYYRRCEASCFAWMCDSLRNSVIATGGGMAHHIPDLNTLGRVILLDVDIETVRERVASKEADKRPLALEESKMISLFNERQATYRRQADLVIDADDDAEAVAQSIAKALK